MQLVSIGLPTFNRSGLIRQALDSLLAQTYSNFELIISDNASTDDTQKICEGYAARDSRIRYIRQKENIGATNNFNFVLQQARGEYFMWAADDDIWHFEFIEKLLEGFVDKSIIGVFCREIHLDDKGYHALLKIPDISPQNSHYRNIVNFFVKSQANLIYSLFSIKVRNYLAMSNFDWCDVFTINRLLLNFKMKIVEGNFFTSRVVEADRRFTPLIAQQKMFRFSSFPYFSRSMSTLWRSKFLSVSQKIRVTILLIGQVTYFFINSLQPK